ncbi:MAG: prolipoprotein diacylglyceryl transferase [Neisseriaceae bacterium]|nr:MAG: prolipoprotein diacylglyceryl transferase [Neisseriaceae bacterium]
MVVHPQFDPVIFTIHPLFTIRWYALTYVLGFIAFLYLGKRKINKQEAYCLDSIDHLDSLFVYGVFGVILGGRLGYVLFYNSSYYLDNPVNILKIWEGGMSFHGGLIGVIIAMIIFSYQKHYKFLEISDFVAPLAPIGLGLGRIGNFINGELWGRITGINHFWAMGFPQAHNSDIRLLPTLSKDYYKAFIEYGCLPRHPSQLYEFLLEGVVLFLILYLFARQKRALGQISAIFLISYGIFRFAIEFSREPDVQLGLLSLGLSMGQWLCVPMILAGVLLYVYTKKHPIQY